jgi:hypothetical protein
MPFSQELENEAKDSCLSKSPNDQYLVKCVYRLMEVGGAGERCLSGIVTVFVCESEASFLCVPQQSSQTTYINSCKRMKSTAKTCPNRFFYSRSF